LLHSDHLSSTCIGASLCSRYALSRPRTVQPLPRRRPLAVAAAVVVVVVAALLFPVASALGFFGPRLYLIVSQDPAELRPYGGYVGAYGLIELSFGRVARLDYGDSKSLDGVYQERLARGEVDASTELTHLYAPGLSPDFPTTARVMVDAYGTMTDDWPDGVVAVDPTIASALLGIVGPLGVPGEPETVTEANLVPLVLKHTQDFAAEDGDRKQFVYDLGLELMGRIRALPPTAWPALVGALARGADERHLQVALDAPLLQRLIHDRGWDGAYPPPADDFVAVVDTNVGYNKANLVTLQELDYSVALGPAGAADAMLTVTYTNQGTGGLGFRTEDMPYLHEAVYDADVQVYVPPGSRPAPGTRGGKDDLQLRRAVLQDHVVVPPGARQAITFQYRVPAPTPDAGRLRYGLLVRKQAGTDGVPVALHVTGPDGWRALDTGQREWQARAQLSVDQRFSVTFERVDG